MCGAGTLPPNAVDIGERLGPCPSCGVEVSIGLVTNPVQPSKKMRALLHAIPFCTYFGRTDTDQIASDINANEARELAAQAMRS